MRTTRRIVNYAVNGVGTGHIMRLMAVNRWLRRLASNFDIEPEIYFLSSSEASSLLFAEAFPSFKLPSKTVIEDSGLNGESFNRLAQEWVTSTLALLRPDLLVVDTFPQGYFNELKRSFKDCRGRAFIYRPLKESHASQPEFQQALGHYDALLVPEYETSARVIIPEAARAATHYVGPIIAREREEILSRVEARRSLAIAEDETVVYISAGGGGDPRAEDQIQAAYEALRVVAGLRLVIGAGPLYRGRPIYTDRVTWLSHGSALELMAAFDVAVSAAGYNSFNELMYVGVPAIFLPQEKWADEQRARAEGAARAGAAVVLDDCSDMASLRLAVENLLDPRRRVAVSQAARALVPINHARDAAQRLLRLLTNV